MPFDSDRALAIGLAAACSGGGFFAFVKRSSFMSLYGGIVFGVLFSTSNYFMVKNWKTQYASPEERMEGIKLAAATSLLLFSVMGTRSAMILSKKAPTSKLRVPMLLAGLGGLASLKYCSQLNSFSDVFSPNIYGVGYD